MRGAFLAWHEVPFLDSGASIRVQTLVRVSASRHGRRRLRDRGPGVTYLTTVRPASAPPAGPAAATFARVLARTPTSSRGAACLARRHHERVVARIERSSEHPAQAVFPLQRRRGDGVVDAGVAAACRLVCALRGCSRARVAHLENALGRRIGCSLHHR